MDGLNWDQRLFVSRMYNFWPGRLFSTVLSGPADLVLPWWPWWVDSVLAVEQMTGDDAACVTYRDYI